MRVYEPFGRVYRCCGKLAADNVVNGYTNNADALTVPLLAAQYAELAEELGLRVAYQNTNYQACVAVESAGTCFRIC